MKSEKLINPHRTKTSTAKVCTVSSAKVKLGYASEEVKYD